MICREANYYVIIYVKIVIHKEPKMQKILICTFLLKNISYIINTKVIHFVLYVEIKN